MENQNQVPFRPQQITNASYPLVTLGSPWWRTGPGGARALPAGSPVASAGTLRGYLLNRGGCTQICAQGVEMGWWWDSSISDNFLDVPHFGKRCSRKSTLQKSSQDFSLEGEATDSPMESLLFMWGTQKGGWRPNWHDCLLSESNSFKLINFYVSI